MVVGMVIVEMGKKVGVRVLEKMVVGVVVKWIGGVGKEVVVVEMVGVVLKSVLVSATDVFVVVALISDLAGFLVLMSKVLIKVVNKIVLVVATVC